MLCEPCPLSTHYHLKKEEEEGEKEEEEKKEDREIWVYQFCACDSVTVYFLLLKKKVLHVTIKATLVEPWNFRQLQYSILEAF